MEKKPTKYYSTKQEKAIADYLGWSAVPASGARLFDKGDVKSADWLAECKTHTEPKDKIVIKKEVWTKLSFEAKSLIRSPILCIDNGTQRINNTWVVIPKRMYSGNGEFTNIACIESDKSFSFSHARAQSVFTINNIYELSINNESLLLMKIEHFKAAFYGGDN
jgi:hypothetical protein